MKGPKQISNQKKPIQYSNRFTYAKTKNHMIDELLLSHIYTQWHDQLKRKHKKTRTRKWDKERTKKKWRKNSDDLKGKHFSCYPFLTFVARLKVAQSRLWAYNTAPICLRIEKKGGVFFALLFLHVFMAGCGWWSNCGRRAHVVNSNAYANVIRRGP